MVLYACCLLKNTKSERQVIPSQFLFYTKDFGGQRYVGNVTIAPMSTQASKTTASGNSLTSAVAGQQQTVSITAKDMYSNVQTSAGDESV